MAGPPIAGSSTTPRRDRGTEQETWRHRGERREEPKFIVSSLVLLYVSMSPVPSASYLYYEGERHMADYEPLPALQISDEQLQDYRDFYTELIGFVPPRIQARTDLAGPPRPWFPGPAGGHAQERDVPPVPDVKTSQLMLFGMAPRSTRRRHPPPRHRRPPRRGHLGGVERGSVNLAFLFQGLNAANLGAIRSSRRLPTATEAERGIRAMRAERVESAKTRRTRRGERCDERVIGDHPSPAVLLRLAVQIVRSILPCLPVKSR